MTHLQPPSCNTLLLAPISHHLFAIMSALYSSQSLAEQVVLITGEASFQLACHVRLVQQHYLRLRDTVTARTAL